MIYNCYISPIDYTSMLHLLMFGVVIKRHSVLCNGGAPQLKALYTLFLGILGLLAQKQLPIKATFFSAVGICNRQFQKKNVRNQATATVIYSTTYYTIQYPEYSVTPGFQQTAFSVLSEYGRKTLY